MPYVPCHIMLHDQYQVVTQSSLLQTSNHNYDHLTINCFYINQKVSGTGYSIFLESLITFPASCISEGVWNLNTVFTLQLLQPIRFETCTDLQRCLYLRAQNVDCQVFLLKLWLDSLPMLGMKWLHNNSSPAADAFAKELTSEVQCQGDFSPDPKQEIIFFIK